MNKDYDRIAAIEKAVAKKYGEEAVKNPKQSWTDAKEEEYSTQMKELYDKFNQHEEASEKILHNGLKVSKKLFNREALQNCSVCNRFSKSSMDDVCFIKYSACYSCYVKYIIDREQRWLNGWRPNS